MSGDLNGAGVAAARQAKLLGVLACPTCDAALNPIETTIVGGAVAEGLLRCDACGTVGLIQRFRPNFFVTDLSELEVPAGAIAEPTADGLLAATREGNWHPIDRGLLGVDVGSRLEGTSSGVGVVFELHAHEWSGKAVFECDESLVVVDLFSDAPASRNVVIGGLADGPHRWSVTVVAGRDPRSHGDQVAIREVLQLTPLGRARPLEFAPVNRGNPYPEAFETLLRTLPTDAIVLDLGGGDRQHHDPRVFNFEYLPYSAVDFYGDGLSLPVRSNSIDAILSQAVLEHVPDPVQAVAEMKRVLRPGGQIYAEFAFMQPLHAVPYHFFNITPHGATLLFEAWDVHNTGVFGGLHETVGWFFRLLDAESRLGVERVASVIGTLTELDALLTDEQLASVASAVFVEASKPAT